MERKALLTKQVQYVWCLEFYHVYQPPICSVILSNYQYFVVSKATCFLRSHSVLKPNKEFLTFERSSYSNVGTSIFGGLLSTSHHQLSVIFHLQMSWLIFSGAFWSGIYGQLRPSSFSCKLSFFQCQWFSLAECLCRFFFFLLLSLATRASDKASLASLLSSLSSSCSSSTGAHAVQVHWLFQRY